MKCFKGAVIILSYKKAENISVPPLPFRLLRVTNNWNIWIKLFLHVVTREKNSPIAALTGHKMWPKWVHGEGPPCPRGYKYGGLALQVGIWVRGRQPGILKKVLGNLNCGFWTVRLSGLELGSGKELEFRTVYTQCTHVVQSRSKEQICENDG